MKGIWKRRPGRLDGVLSDIRSARRTLGRAPGFLCVTSLTLAVSIGATTAVFAVVDGVLIMRTGRRCLAAIAPSLAAG